MKFLNLKRKLRNSALAVLFAVAVMFVMPATVFADDTDVIDNDISTNVEAETDIENNDNFDSEIGFDAESPAVTEDFLDHMENTDPLIPCDNCYGICCNACDEDCDGTCCDMCTIINHADDVNIPDNSEYEFVDDFTANTDVPDDFGSETDNIAEENGSFGDPYGETTVDPTDADELTNSNENIIPAIPNEPIFPDDYYNNVIVPENPEYVYQPEFGNETTDGATNFDNENEEEIIFDDDLTGGEDEIIFGDEDDDEKPEIPDASNSDDSDNTLSDENSDNSDEENADNTTDEENNDNSDNENSDIITDEDVSDDLDNTADEEGSDNSDEENSDDAADEEAPDDSDSEALEDDNPIINVVLPVSISVVVNPYNLKTADENGFHYSILSPEYSIKNYSNCDISIVATVSASTEGGIVLSPYDLSGNETEFTAFAYLEATNESNVYSDNYNNNANQLAFSNEVMSKEILTLADGSNGETIGYFRIKGQAVLPDGVQYSDKAMLNMLITFNINSVSKSVVSNDAVEETENAENTENSENIESTENFENVEYTENSENTEDIQEFAD